MGQNLITREQYKAYAGISNPNSDTEIDSILTGVSDFIKTYCKRSFVDYVAAFKTQVSNGGVGAIILEETPCISVRSVEYSANYGLDYTELSEFTDWVLDDDYIVSVSPSGFPNMLRGYKVTYTAGYAEVPSDLKLAIFDLITYYRRNDSSVHSTKAPGTNSVQVEFITTTSIPAHIRRILDFYRSDFA